MNNSKYQSKIDYGIILSVFILFVTSIVSVYATTALMGQRGLQPTVMQVIWYLLGALLVVVIMQLNSKKLWKCVPAIYGLAIVLLVAVLLFYDRSTAALFGAKSWFRLGSLSFQPAEFSKIALILMLARVVTNHNTKFRKRTLKTDKQLLLKIIKWTLPILLLVMAENDLGTTLVLIAIVSGVTLMSGISSKLLLPIFIGLLAVGGILLYLVVYHREWLMLIGFKPYQFSRIDSWLKPFDNTASTSYQIQNAILAISTGGLLGKGIGVTQVHIPVRESDMIFSTIGENVGFIGSLFVIFVYIALIYQMVRVCFDTKNEFYTYISVGVISMVFFHVFENIGMNINVLPLTGIPLPFISQGGSSLVVNMIGVGLIMAMRYQVDSEYRV